MSTFYASSNNETTIALFGKRFLYKFGLAQRYGGLGEDSNVIDFTIGEKFLFGRVSPDLIPMVVNSGMHLKNFTTKNLINPQQNQSALNFVVDVFNEMATQFQKCAATGKIAANDKYLSNLKVHKAFIDPKARYDQYRKAYTNAFKEDLKRKNIKITNFTELINAFMNTVKNSGLSFPFTYSAYVKSAACPINCSGMAIEIADLNFADDDVKISEFIESLNWDFYVNTCNSYGFMIDMNAPWRIVADIDSEIMREYSKLYKLGSPNAIFTYQFRAVYVEAFYNLQYYLLDLYNQVKSTRHEYNLCSDGTITARMIHPDKVTKEDLKFHYSKQYFLKLYLKLRFLEEESQFTDQEQESLIRECVTVARQKGYNTALRIFEQIINKTFDYNGSLSYIINTASAPEEQIEGSTSTVSY